MVGVRGTLTGYSLPAHVGWGVGLAGSVPPSSPPPPSSSSPRPKFEDFGPSGVSRRVQNFRGVLLGRVSRRRRLAGGRQKLAWAMALPWPGPGPILWTRAHRILRPSLILGFLKSLDLCENVLSEKYNFQINLKNKCRCFRYGLKKT